MLSGPIGLYGTTVLSTREGLGFEADIASDSQPLHRLVRAMVEAVGPALHALRDPTRGGLASAVNELAQASAVGVELDETALPVPPAVAAACDMLGLDPLHVANEGCLVAFVAADRADRLLAAMRSVPEGTGAVRVGTVLESNPGQVTVRTLLGVRRVVDMPGRTGPHRPSSYGLRPALCMAARSVNRSWRARSELIKDRGAYRQRGRSRALTTLTTVRWTLGGADAQVRCP